MVVVWWWWCGGGGGGGVVVWWWCGGVVVWWCGYFTDNNTTLRLHWVTLGCGNSHIPVGFQASMSAHAGKGDLKKSRILSCL